MIIIIIIVIIIYEREGNFTRSADTFTEEINIFSGKDNRITFRRVYTKSFKVTILYSDHYELTFINGSHTVFRDGSFSFF